MDVPEISEEPAVREIHMALLRATEALSLSMAAPEQAVQRARHALDAAVTSAATARRVVAEARAARNRRP